ncbi:transposase [Sorangium sp. So ce233]|uniref:transposase n=1 Tax=Sorangium sp. So ce233 TaxID=3133290 RepID=UPI003F64417B
MRHGRKSRSKRFDGYKEHIARDLDLPVIVACAVTPANRPEEEGAAPIAEDIQRQRLRLGELHIDRAYVNSPVVDDVIRDGGQVFSKPWGQRARSPDLISKRDFKIDLRAKTITCPAGQVEVFEPGDTVEFDPEECSACFRSCRRSWPSRRSPRARSGTCSASSWWSAAPSGCSGRRWIARGPPYAPSSTSSPTRSGAAHRRSDLCYPRPVLTPPPRLARLVLATTAAELLGARRLPEIRCSRGRADV